MQIRKIAASLFVAIGLITVIHNDALAQAKPSQQVSCSPQSVAADASAGLIIMKMDRPSLWSSSDAERQKNNLLVAALDFYLLIWEKCRLGLIADNEDFFNSEEVAQELRLWVEQQKRQ